MTSTVDMVLTEILKKKTNDGKDNLQINGLGFVHPIHEAVVATFKQNFSDSEISTRFAKDENSLRAVIAAESLMDGLDSRKKQELKQLVVSGAPLNEIAGKAALQLAENRRMQDGKILEQVARTSKQPMEYVIDALKSESREILYVDGNRMQEIDKRAFEIGRARRSKTILGSLLGALIFVAAYRGVVDKKDFVKEMATRRVTAEKVVAGLEAKAKDTELYVAKLDSEKLIVESYERQAVEKQKSITQLSSSMNLIQEDVVKKREVASELEKTLAANNKEISSSKSKLEEIRTSLNIEEGRTKKLADDYFKIGCGYYANAKEDEALEAFKRASELAPKNIGPLNALAAVYLKKKDYSLATEQIRKAQKIEPNSSLLNNNLAACHALMGNNSLAIETYNKVLEKEPNNKLVYYNLGNLYSASSSKLDAIRCYKQYLNLEDTFIDSKVVEVREKVAKLESEK